MNQKNNKLLEQVTDCSQRRSMRHGILSTKNLSLKDCSSMRKLDPNFYGHFKILENITYVVHCLKLSAPMRAIKMHDAFHTSLLQSIALRSVSRIHRTSIANRT